MSSFLPHVSARRLGALFALLTVLVVLAACDSATPHPTGVVQSNGAAASTSAAATPTAATSAAQWQLTWVPASDGGGDSASDSPIAAFQASALARDPSGALHAPAAAWWLATGPGFALALVQLDPAGQSIGFVVMARGTALGPTWSPVVSSQEQRPTAEGGRAYGPLPGGDYDCTGYDVHSTPALSATLCLAPARVFFYGRFTLAAERPMGAATVTVNGRDGWLASTDSAGFVNALVVPLADGATYVFGGTAPAKQLVTLAADLEGPLLAAAA